MALLLINEEENEESWDEVILEEGKIIKFLTVIMKIPQFCGQLSPQIN